MHGIVGRRSALGGFIGLLVATPAWADAVVVPVSLQAELVGKIVPYDRSPPVLAGDRLVVLILVRAGSADSERAAAQMEDALGLQPEIGGYAHASERVTFTTPADVARAVKVHQAGVLYVTPGLSGAAPAIAASLDDVDVLSVAAVPGDVASGIVVGFDVDSGRPKILVNLVHAKRQHVDFQAAFLKLTRVVAA